MLVLCVLADTNRWAVRNGYERVSVGDVFTRDVRFKSRMTPQQLEQEGEIVSDRPVTIKVEDIHYYREFQPHILKNQTAIMTLSGEGLDGLTNESVLMRRGDIENTDNRK